MLGTSRYVSCRPSRGIYPTAARRGGVALSLCDSMHIHRPHSTSALIAVMTSASFEQSSAIPAMALGHTQLTNILLSFTGMS